MKDDLRMRLTKMSLVSMPALGILVHTGWAGMDVDLAICKFLGIEATRDNYQRAAETAKGMSGNGIEHGEDYDVREETRKLWDAVQ